MAIKSNGCDMMCVCACACVEKFQATETTTELVPDRINIGTVMMIIMIMMTSHGNYVHTSRMYKLN